ncbi:hypothetical protein QLQ12_44805 [Actinoplanes sp. NEAU-A12]|uniref:Uncharacterized protein n=1 Tax=Actinoplanes sandaracinus TaxID=3045177 RepID=A0ABT6X125_9ACTN|nr:hypothetical protein [Actinoplanes sandaracinus]MDI6105722.1 hypothetical protein [Actinoplanes sandaracinus]
MTMLEGISSDGLTVRVGHRRNPYAYLFDGDQFDELLLRLGRRRADSIWRHHRSGEDRAPHGRYGRPCMAFVVMDATAGAWVPDTEAVLAAITIGTDGERFLPNAAGKACGHRRLGANYGEAVLVDSHRCHSGGFRYGHSAEIRGQIVGASSQTTDQDLYEAGHLAADLVAAVNHAQVEWKERAGPGEWFNDGDVPGEECLAAVSWFNPTVSATAGTAQG